MAETGLQPGSGLAGESGVPLGEPPKFTQPRGKLLCVAVLSSALPKKESVMQKTLIASAAVVLTAATVLVAWADGANAAPRCQDVLRYLRADAEDSGGAIQRWRISPRVRYVAAQDGEAVDPEATEMLRLAKSDTDFVVWLLNKYLPKDWQLRLGTTHAGANAFEPGTVNVFYLPRKYWPEALTRNDSDKVWGKGIPVHNKDGEITAAAVLVDHTRLPDDRNRIHVLLHEMLHVLGRGHVDRWEFPDTIMHADSSKDDHRGDIKALDKAALRAVYGRLGVGMAGQRLREPVGPSRRPGDNAFERFFAKAGVTWGIDRGYGPGGQKFRGYRTDKDGNLRAVYDKTPAELVADAKRRGERLSGLPVGAEGDSLRCDSQGRIRGDQ